MMATMRGLPQVFVGDEMMFVSKDLSQGHGGLRVDFPGGWEGDKVNLFTAEGRAQHAQATELYDYSRTLFQWRKTKEVIDEEQRKLKKESKKKPRNEKNGGLWNRIKKGFITLGDSILGQDFIDDEDM